jgi:Thiamine pyrophosphate enzyme, central domain
MDSAYCTRIAAKRGRYRATNKLSQPCIKGNLVLRRRLHRRACRGHRSRPQTEGPDLHAFRGKEFVEYDNPYDVGMTGLVGFASGYAAIKNCDALLMLGTDFPYRAFYPEHAKIAQVDVRPEALGNRCSLHLGLLGNVKDTLDAVLPSIRKRSIQVISAKR